MTLSDFSIKKPVFAWMLMAALIVFGTISFRRMGVSQLPQAEFPVVSVDLAWEGAAPEVMETDVVDIVEDAITSIQGIRDISSTSRQGQASVTIEFDLERDIDVALQEVQTKIAQAQRRLPNELDPPIVTKVNPQDQPIMWIGVSGDVPKRDLMEYVQDHLKDQFQTINGVGEIFLGGFIERNLRVWLDTEKLSAYQLTVQDIIDAIQREHAELPAGRIETGTQELNVRAMGEAYTVEEFERLIITRRGGQPIYTPIHLKEVATIEDGLADARRLSRIMGKTAVGMGIRKQRGANEVKVAHRIKQKMAEVKRRLPPGIELGVNFDRTQFIEDSINELAFTLMLSAILTSLVCWLFLGSWSATLNILLAIPTAIVGSFTRQITGAALAATLAITAVFLPVAFMTGIIGKFFFEFGVAISVAVALSLLEALTLAPMRCAQFLQVGERGTALGKAVEAGFHHVADWYRRGLARALRHRWKVLLGSLVFFAASLGFVSILRKEFVPPQDQSMFLVRLQTPVGSSIELTDGKFKLAEAIAMSRPEIRRYFGAIGGFGGGEVNTGVLFVTFKPPRERPVVPPNKRPLSQRELMAVFRKELNAIPDLKAYVQDLSLSGFSAQRGFPIELSIRGPDWDQLAEHSEAIRARMAANPLMVDADTDYLTGVPEVQVRPDRQKAAERGISMETIGRTINAMIGGERVAKYTRGGRRYDVRVRLIPSQRTQKEDIERLWVWNQHGELVQLKDVVTIIEKPTLLTITRKNRERAISLFANVAPGKSLADALAEVNRIVKETLPEGYHAVFGGSTETFKESFQSLLFALVLGIIVAYMVLGSQYNSYLHPVTVLLALPFSISGAFGALWLGRQSLNLFSFIGLILLMGIVKKNSILLVDFTNQLREQGLNVHDALMQACPIRLRPILMTSFSTVAAAIPPALAMGPGAETRMPMAIAVIGGLTVSTLLTLFVVPCAYSLFSKLERKQYPASAQDVEPTKLFPTVTTRPPSRVA
ncbi:MAG: efflux RND transporter permease subunit [Candidatus Omnitrophica bacterium]|nr:efflux RND transporter permease subunit [Candidatus Omnitrophota bacterium]